MHDVPLSLGREKQEEEDYGEGEVQFCDGKKSRERRRIRKRGNTGRWRLK